MPFILSVPLPIQGVLQLIYISSRKAGTDNPFKSPCSYNLTSKRKWKLGWWFTLSILSTQEAEIRRIAVQSQPGQTVCEILSCKYPTYIPKQGLVEWLVRCRP
jgi:hypothetical protein